MTNSARHFKKIQKPIVSTSANISGQQAPVIYSEITQEIKNSVIHCHLAAK